MIGMHKALCLIPGFSATQGVALFQLSIEPSDLISW